MNRATFLTTFKHSVVVAALVGLLAGLLLTLIQQLQVVPLIAEAERYEQTAVNAKHDDHQHDSASASSHHEHTQGAWHPEQGWERNLYTAGANIVVAFGFALLVGSATTLRGAQLSWRSGLLWGLGGYVTFFVAPSFGLPPDLPGTEAASLLSRQTWWVTAAFATASGLWLLVFARRHVSKIVGVAVLVMPHVVGAPQPEIVISTAPDELAKAFVIATTIANAVFWLSLGGLYGLLQGRKN